MQNFILADELFTKGLQILETCVRGKLVSTLVSPITFDHYDLMKNLSYFITIFIDNFSLLTCELDNFTFKTLY